MRSACPKSDPDGALFSLSVGYREFGAALLRGWTVENARLFESTLSGLFERYIDCRTISALPRRMWSADHLRALEGKCFQLAGRPEA